ncbi:MAG: RluA family pseudouridine synthase [Mangrovibacterium sp.]
MKREQAKSAGKAGKRQQLSIVVKEPEELMKFLIGQLPHKNRNNIKTLLRKREVLVDGKAISQFNHVLKSGQQVVVGAFPGPRGRQMHGVVVVHEDDELIVVNKKAGLLSMATDREKRNTVYRMLSGYVKEEDKGNKIFVVHRLDRETSGLMLFAKNRRMQGLLQTSWKQTVSERSYLAVIEGQLDPPEGTVSSYLFESKAYIVYSSSDPDRGSLAVTSYRTLKWNERYSLLQMNLDTGRKNQIRVHLKDLNHPVVGDKKYGSGCNALGRLGLHAWVLAFTHPLTGEKMRFQTSVPGSFLKLF